MLASYFAYLAVAKSGIAMLSTGIWPSSEISSLYERVRVSEGIRKELTEEPCDIVDGDSDYLNCLLVVAVHNFWDLVFVSSEPRFVVFFSHDEYFGIAEAAEIDSYRDALTSMGIESW